MGPRRLVFSWRVLVVLVLVWGGSVPGVRAHDVDFSKFRVTFFEDGTFQADVNYDADAFVADVPPGHSSEEVARILETLDEERKESRLDDLRRMFQVRVRLRFDGEPVLHEVVFPRLGQGRRGDAEPGLVPGDLVRLEGEVPAGARTFVFWASRGFGTVTLEVGRAGEDGVRQVLQVAERSEPFLLSGVNVERSWAGVLWDYGVLGFEHILPKGVDHILFILGLFLLSIRWKPLLFQVTAFTVAHSVTLALSMFGLVSLPASIVEPLIALSIAYVAIENLFTSRLTPWRPTVVFAFGLLHGMGFAGVLRELGLPPGDYVSALIGFNLGVEAGQLAVVTLAFLAVGWWRSREWYRVRLVVPASVGIAGVGLYWAVERVVG